MTTEGGGRRLTSGGQLSQTSRKVCFVSSFPYTLLHDVPRYATDRTSGCQRARFLGGEPSQSLTPPSLNPCMFVFAGPCLLFPTCSNRLLGGSNQVFIARLQAFFLSLTTGLAVSLDRNLWSTTSRKSSHTKACRGSVTGWIPGQNFNHAIGAMKDVKLKRVHVKVHRDRLTAV